MTQEEISKLKASVDAAKAKQAEEQKSKEELDLLIKEAKELGIEVPSSKKEEETDTKKQQAAENAEEEQSETEEKDDQHELINKAADQIAAKISEAINKKPEEQEEKEVTKIYM